MTRRRIVSPSLASRRTAGPSSSPPGRSPSAGGKFANGFYACAREGDERPALLVACALIFAAGFAAAASVLGAPPLIGLLAGALP